MVGGGRWSRVICSVIARCGYGLRDISIVTQRDPGDWLARINQEAYAGQKYSMVRSLDELLQRNPPEAAIVANDARSHGTTAAALLTCGVSTLVEKPACLSEREAERLLELAGKSAAILRPALVFQYCTYLHEFSAHLRRQRSAISRSSIVWCDPVGEARYGESKSYDVTLSVAADVLPHIWTLLSILPGATTIDVTQCRIERGGRTAVFELCIQGIRTEVRLERDGRERKREFSVGFANGNSLVLDFTIEPGTIRGDGPPISGDPEWRSNPTPLTRQLAAFLEEVGTPSESSTVRPATALLQTVRLGEQGADLLRIQQRSWISRMPLAPVQIDEDIRYALMGVLADTTCASVGTCSHEDRIRALISAADVAAAALARGIRPDIPR